MTHQIIGKPVYPIGEFQDGSRLCVSIEAGRPEEWFPGHRDFDCVDSSIQLDSSDFLDIEVDDDAPTLRDEDVQALTGGSWWKFWN